MEAWCLPEGITRSISTPEIFKFFKNISCIKIKIYSFIIYIQNIQIEKLLIFDILLYFTLYIEYINK